MPRYDIGTDVLKQVYKHMAMALKFWTNNMHYVDIKFREVINFQTEQVSFYCSLKYSSGAADNILCNMLDKSRTGRQFVTLNIRS